MSDPVIHAVERLLQAPVSHTGLRAFCRSLDELAYLAPKLTREEDLPFGFRQSIEDARDFLEDLSSQGNDRHMTSLIRQASDCLGVFEDAFDDDDEEDDNDEENEPQGEDCHHCWVCGRTLTDPRSIERSLGPRCLTAVRYWDGIWAEVQVVAPDLASRVKAKEMTRWDAVDEFEHRAPVALDEIGERVWRGLRQARGSGRRGAGVNGSDH